ncbi:TPA: arylamine N-acetyltransferase, partial [Bacillus cereus]|nr:arylamine N-acetyltransferase [Bacillus cereus]
MMTKLQKEFFKRLEIPAKEITFDDLDEILLKMGMILPYENLDIMAGTIKNISKDNLIEKLLIQ